MDTLPESFIDYDDDFINFDLIRDAHFYVASPDSASTQTKTNSHSPELQNSFPSNEQIIFESPACAGSYPPQRIESPLECRVSNNNVYINQNILDPIAFQANFDDKIANKSKRIMKRNEAKERTKTRQEATVSLSINNAYGQDIADNQDFDDSVKKKMALKMKNRIAAQNSRDRKKIYAQQLEEANENLIQENIALQKDKDTLLNEVAKLQQNEARLVQEIETLKANISACFSCGKQSGRVPSYDEESNNNYYPINYGQPAPENSGPMLSSPILARFPSAGRKMFTFLTLSCFVGLILFANIHQKGEIALSGPVTLKDRGLLEFKDEVCDACHHHNEMNSDEEHEHEQNEYSRQDSLLSSTKETLKEILSFDLQTSLVKQLSSQDESKEDLIRRDSAVRAELEGKNTDDWDSVCLMQSDSPPQKYSFDLQESDSCTIEQIEAEEVLFLKRKD